MLWQWDSENILTIAFTVFLITATQSKYNFQVTKIRNTLKAYNFSLFHVCATVEKRAPSISSLPCTKWGYRVKSINSTDENHCNQWWTLQSFLWMKMRSQSQFTIQRVLSVKITISLRQRHSAYDFASGVIRIWQESQDIALNQLILVTASLNKKIWANLTSWSRFTESFRSSYLCAFDVFHASHLLWMKFFLTC